MTYTSATAGIQNGVNTWHIEDRSIQKAKPATDQCDHVTNITQGRSTTQVFAQGRRTTQDP